MKLKIVSTLLLLAGSAYSQLISVREESGLLNAYPEGALLTFAGEGSSIPLPAYEPIHSPLSFRHDFPVTPVFAENQRFGASLDGVGLHRFATYSVSGAEASSFSTALDLTPVTAASGPPSDTFPISHDQGISALIAASTIP